MPFSNDPSLMREIILDHYQYPRNKKKPTTDDYLSIHMDSASCIDDFYIYIKVENDKVVDCLFDGIGCAISTASISIMTQLIKGKEIKKALEIVDNYKHMIHHDHEYDEECSCGGHHDDEKKTEAPTEAKTDKLSSSPAFILGNPASFSVPAVSLPWINLSVKSGTLVRLMVRVME